MKFKIGDKVIINGNLYSSSNASKPSGSVKNKVTNVTRIASGSKHPYNTTGDLGWMDEKDINLYKDEKTKYEVEIEVIDKESLIEYLKNHTGKIIMMNADDLKKVFDL